MKTKRILAFLLLALMMLCLSACKREDAALSPSTSPSTAPSMMPTTMPGTSPAPGTGMDGTGAPNDAAATDDAAQTASMTAQESAALSKKANDAATKLSEIGACVTAIVGDTCIAGVSFDGQYAGGMTERVRDMVSARIRAVAPAVTRVAVTSDAALVSQIAALSDKIAKSTTLDAVAGEFSGIMAQMQ